MTRALASLLLVLSVAPPSYAQSAPGEPQLVTVSGTAIADRTERPIKGVLVYLEGQSTITETDADGRFRLTAPAGRQTVTASIIGYALLTTDIDIAASPIDMT